jgi:small subunit ribosomal protein S21
MKLDPNRKAAAGEAVMAAVVAVAAEADTVVAAAVAVVTKGVLSNNLESCTLPDITGRVFPWGECMPLRMRVHDREPIGSALRRFKKLLERSGLQKELRKRKHYEKPCELRRRAKLRKQSAIRKAKIRIVPGGQ